MISSSSDQDEATWGIIAWIIPLVGAILALVLRPEYKYAKYWAYLNLSYLVVVVVGAIIASILGIIPIVGWLLSILIWAALLVLWIVGIVKAAERVYWKPPLIYDIAKVLGIEKTQ